MLKSAEPHRIGMAGTRPAMTWRASTVTVSPGHTTPTLDPSPQGGGKAAGRDTGPYPQHPTQTRKTLPNRPRSSKTSAAKPDPRRNFAMHALFVGQTYIDVTFLADELPTGDEKTVARDYAISFGGNAVTAGLRLRQARHRARPPRPRSPTTGSAACSSTWRRNTASRSITGRCTNRPCPSSCRRAASAPSCAAATTITCIRCRR